MEIILASTSPRRKEILGQLGLRFKILNPEVEENIREGEHPVDFVRRMAQEKGLFALTKIQKIISKEFLIISCDTEVIVGKEKFGKPEDRKKAQQMLKSLRNRQHYVVSALSIIHSSNSTTRKALAHTVSKIKFKDFSDETIEQYLDMNEWQGKAGAYAIQGSGSFFLNWFQGSLTSIIGFPVRLFFRALVGMKIDILSLFYHT